MLLLPFSACASSGGFLQRQGRQDFESDLGLHILRRDQRVIHQVHDGDDDHRDQHAQDPAHSGGACGARAYRRSVRIACLDDRGRILVHLLADKGCRDGGGPVCDLLGPKRARIRAGDVQDAGVGRVRDADLGAKLVVVFLQLQAGDHPLQDRAAGDDRLVIRGQVAADLQVREARHGCALAEDVEACRGGVLRGDQEAAVGIRRPCAQECAQEDQLPVSKQDRSQFQEVDLEFVVCLRADRLFDGCVTGIVHSVCFPLLL